MIITALLRISEIEQSRRRAGFRNVVRAELVQEIGEFYEPSAEDKHIKFSISVTDDLALLGDRDLALPGAPVHRSASYVTKCAPRRLFRPA